MVGADFSDHVEAFLHALGSRWRELDGYAVNADRILAADELQRLGTADGRAFLSAVRTIAFEAYVSARDRARAQDEEAEEAGIELVKASAIYTFVDSLTNIPAVGPADPDGKPGRQHQRLHGVR